jgi:hypothetical protein
MKYSFEEVSDYTIWNNFNELSPQGTIFSNVDYLEAAQVNYKLYFAYRGDKIKAGIAVCLSDNNENVILDEFVIYNGILFKDDPVQKEVAAKLERQEITEFIIQRLTDQYKNIAISMAPQFEDLRPFIWHKYGSNTQSELFKLNLRYTSYLDISEFRLKNDYYEMQMFKNMARLRRRKIKDAITNGATVTEDMDPCILVNYYENTLRKQNMNVSAKKISRIKSLHLKFNDLNIGKTFYVVEKDGLVSYAISVCYDNKRGYALFASGNSDSNLTYPGTYAYYSVARYLSITNRLNVLDLEGINSPERSKFKMGFGGEITKYFEIILGNQI